MIIGIVVFKVRRRVFVAWHLGVISFLSLVSVFEGESGLSCLLCAFLMSGRLHTGAVLLDCHQNKKVAGRERKGQRTRIYTRMVHYVSYNTFLVKLGLQIVIRAEYDPAARERAVSQTKTVHCFLPSFLPSTGGDSFNGSVLLVNLGR